MVAKLNLPIWYTRVFKAVHLVQIIHSHHLLLVAALPKHHVGLLLVERAAHPTVCGMHGEDGQSNSPSCSSIDTS